MTPEAQRTDRLAGCENSALVKMARQLQDDLSSEATLVMGQVLAELATRYNEADFLAICADLDGRLAAQEAAADPMHY